MSTVMSSNGGLQMLLERLGSVGNLVAGKPLFVALLKLLNMCVKVKVNRVELLRPEMNAISYMLDALNMVRDQVLQCIDNLK